MKIYTNDLVKGHSDFKVKCLTFGLYTQVSDSGPLGPLVRYLFTLFPITCISQKLLYICLEMPTLVFMSGKAKVARECTIYTITSWPPDTWPYKNV